MLYRVFNQGEIPTLGHGWRSVVALTPGRKWLTVIDWTTLESARIEIALWENLKPHATSGMNRRKVRAAMRRRLHYAMATRAVNEALRLLKDASP
jgi:hypothetical protein